MAQAKILLCEDNAAINAALSTILEKVGFEVSHTTDGDEALEWLRTRSFDLAILDLDIPKISGATLLLNIRKVNPCLEAIFISTLHEESMLRELMRAGAYDFLGKPFDEKILMNAVEGALKRNQFYEKKEQLLNQLLEKEVALQAELNVRDEEIKNLRTGAGVEVVMANKIEKLKKELIHTRRSLVAHGGDTKILQDSQKPDPENINKQTLEIHYPSRIFSILNMFFLVGAFFFAFAAVFFSGKWFGPGQFELSKWRLPLQSELILVALIWLESGLMVKLHSVLHYFRLNPLVDEFEERRRIRERAYGFLTSILVIGAFVSTGSAVQLLCQSLKCLSSDNIPIIVATFLDSPVYEAFHLRLLATTALLLFGLLLLVLRLNLRYQQNLEQRMQRANTKSLLDRI